MEQFLDVAKTIGIALGEIIITAIFCVQYIKKNIKKPDISKMIPKQNEIDLDIIGKMDYTKELLNADRIHLYEFHNGEHYADYRSALKFSCSYEVTKAGTASVMHKCTSIPISVMPKFINKITTEGCFYCNNIEEIKDTMASTYAFKNNLNIESFYDIAIKNPQGMIIGFIAVQWDKGTKRNLNPDEIKKLVWYVEEKIQCAIALNKGAL